MNKWLDGPGFLEWLEEVVPESMAQAASCSGHTQGWQASLGRRSSDWRKGSPVTVISADRYLIHLGLHLSLVPDELFREVKYEMKKVPA